MLHCLEADTLDGGQNRFSNLRFRFRVARVARQPWQQRQQQQQCVQTARRNARLAVMHIYIKKRSISVCDCGWELFFFQTGTESLVTIQPDPKGTAETTGVREHCCWSGDGALVREVLNTPPLTRSHTVCQCNKSLQLSTHAHTHSVNSSVTLI